MFKSFPRFKGLSDRAKWYIENGNDLYLNLARVHSLTSSSKQEKNDLHKLFRKKRETLKGCCVCALLVYELGKGELENGLEHVKNLETSEELLTNDLYKTKPKFIQKGKITSISTIEAFSKVLLRKMDTIQGAAKLSFPNGINRS